MAVNKDKNGISIPKKLIVVGTYKQLSKDKQEVEADQQAYPFVSVIDVQSLMKNKVFNAQDFTMIKCFKFGEEGK
jgi:hypothetical protein